MKEEAKPESWSKTLKQLNEELHPEGAKVEKSELIGEELEIREIKPWKSDGKNVIRVTAVRVTTGELVTFNGGEPMYNAVHEFVNNTPFFATMAEKTAKNGRSFFILE